MHPILRLLGGVDKKDGNWKKDGMTTSRDANLRIYDAYTKEENGQKEVVFITPFRIIYDKEGGSIGFVGVGAS